MLIATLLQRPPPNLGPASQPPPSPARHPPLHPACASPNAEDPVFVPAPSSLLVRRVSLSSLSLLLLLFFPSRYCTHSRPLRVNCRRHTSTSSSDPPISDPPTPSLALSSYHLTLSLSHLVFGLSHFPLFATPLYIQYTVGLSRETCQPDRPSTILSPWRLRSSLTFVGVPRPAASVRTRASRAVPTPIPTQTPAVPPMATVMVTATATAMGMGMAV